MDSMKQPLAEIFDLLSREEELLLDQIAEEHDMIERIKIIHDLKNVRIILADIISQLTIKVEPAYLQPALQVYQI